MRIRLDILTLLLLLLNLRWSWANIPHVALEPPATKVLADSMRKVPIFNFITGNLDPCPSGAPKGNHCSMMCKPVFENLPALPYVVGDNNEKTGTSKIYDTFSNANNAFGSCWSVGIDTFMTDPVSFQFTVRNMCPDKFVFHQMAIQAMDEYGFAIGQWELATPVTLKPFCNYNGDEFEGYNHQKYISAVQNYPTRIDLNKYLFPDNDLPSVEKVECPPESLAGSTHAPKSGSGVNYLLIDQSTRKKVRPVMGVSAIWSYTGPEMSELNSNEAKDGFGIFFRVELTSDTGGYFPNNPGLLFVESRVLAPFRFKPDSNGIKGTAGPCFNTHPSKSLIAHGTVNETKLINSIFVENSALVKAIGKKYPYISSKPEFRSKAAVTSPKSLHSSEICVPFGVKYLKESDDPATKKKRECDFSIGASPLLHQVDVLVFSIDMKGPAYCKLPEFQISEAAFQGFDEKGLPFGTCTVEKDFNSLHSECLVGGNEQHTHFPIGSYAHKNCNLDPQFISNSHHDPSNLPGYCTFTFSSKTTKDTKGFFVLWKFDYGTINRIKPFKPVKASLRLMAEFVANYKAPPGLVGVPARADEPFVMHRYSKTVYYTPSNLFTASPAMFSTCAEKDEKGFASLSDQFAIDDRTFEKGRNPVFPAVLTASLQKTTTTSTTTTTTTTTPTTTTTSSTTTLAPTTVTVITPSKPTSSRTTFKAPTGPPEIEAPPPGVELHEKSSTPDPHKTEEEKKEKEKERDDIYSRCEITKKCLGGSFNSDLKSKGAGQAGVVNPCIKARICDVLVSFGRPVSDNEDEIYLELLGNTHVWVALGISRDKKMGQDFVVECVREGVEVSLYYAWNSGPLKTATEVNDLGRKSHRLGHEKFIRKYETGYVDSNMYCKFGLKKFVQYFDTQLETEITFNLGEELYFILFAVGYHSGGMILGLNGTLNYHGDHQTAMTESQVALGARFSPTPLEQRYLFAHGALMYVTYLFFFPIASFIARYFKETLIKKIYGFQMWSLLHAILQSFGLVAIFVGHFFLTIGNDGWTRLSTKQDINYHFWGALSSASLYFFNCFVGLINQERAPGIGCNFWSWIHSTIGHLSYLLGLATLLHVREVLYSYLPCWALMFIVAWIIVYVIFHVIMSLHVCWLDWIYGKLTSRVYASGPLRVFVQPNSGVVPPGPKLRIAMLIAFSAVCLVFTLISVYLIIDTYKNHEESEFPCRKLIDFVDL